MTEIEGKSNAAGLRLAIVSSRFNSEIVDRLIEGALHALRQSGADLNDVTLLRVPGAFEIPLIVQRMAASRRFDAVVAIGCVIRGETPHFEYISREVSSGLSRVALDTGIPVSFGVLTVDTDDQAMARSGAGPENKGFEATMAAIEMANLLKQI